MKGKSRYYFKYIGSVWAKLYKKELILKCNVKFVEHIISEDIWFNFQILKYVDKFICVDQNLYFWRNNKNSNSYKFKEDYYSEVKQAYIIMKEYFVDKQERFYFNNVYFARMFHYIDVWVFQNSIFHLENANGRKEKISKCNSVLADKIFIEILHNVDMSILSWKKKILFLLCKKKLSVLIFIMYKFMLLKKGLQK